MTRVLAQRARSNASSDYLAAHLCLRVCEEMCPVPEKAIKLETVDAVTPDGETVTVQRPRVVRERCIGCGICKYKCPVNGEAAIRVYVPPDIL